MADKPKVSYKRAPSDKLLRLLMPGGDLSWLVELGREEIGGQNIHFRNKAKSPHGTEVHIYREGARLLRLEWFVQKREIKLTADKKYMNETRVEGFFGRHNVADTMSKGFQDKCELYLCGVDIASNQKGKEGAVQTKWASVKEYPWTPFDREVALQYESERYRMETRKLPDVDKAYADIQALAAQHGWDEPEEPKPGGRNQVDQLAVDDNGCLVIVELKDVTDGGGKEAFYSPFQALQYLWEWHNILEDVQRDLQELINARKEVGLMSGRGSVPKLSGGIRAAVGFGCDGRTDEVKRRYGNSARNRKRPSPSRCAQNTDVGLVG